MNRAWRLVPILLAFLAASAARAQTAPDRDEIVHVLNRITFGPCPGDVEMVQKMGLHNYIEQQLHPETIDDSAAEQDAARFALLQLPCNELNDGYEAKILDEKKKELQALNGLAGPVMTTMTAQTEVEPAPAGDAAPAPGESPATPPMSSALPSPASPPAATPAPTPPPAPPTKEELAQAKAAEAKAKAEEAKAKAKVKAKQDMMKSVDQADRHRSYAALGELQQAKLVRAVESRRQLQEVLVDFWGNHFNIDVTKNLDRIYKVADDRDVIRPHIWGKFRDLLEASAKSPAMLEYLDNASNTVLRVSAPPHATPAPAPAAAAGAPAAPAKPAPPSKPMPHGASNENYGRELMELHTLGVDGGYTQKDVEEVARCFTGWTIDRPTGQFVFRAKLHDDGEKVVLGHTIPADGGVQDGETVLDILCAQPACAHHISLQLCQRFVSDDPPTALVDRIAGVFTKSGGDLRAVTEAILTSPEFLSPANFNNKIKSPFEFAVSAVRASASTLGAQEPAPFEQVVPMAEGMAVFNHRDIRYPGRHDADLSLNWHILKMGEPLFACLPPTGYKEVSKAWLTPGGLIERLNFANALTSEEISDVHFDPQKILAGVDGSKPEAVLQQTIATVLHNNVADSTRKVLEQSALAPPGGNPQAASAHLIALMIGSPDFQLK
jgi:uncharacterized protein (DUF1800 family)